jgi:hypothetical protein
METMSVPLGWRGAVARAIQTPVLDRRAAACRRHLAGDVVVGEQRGAGHVRSVARFAKPGKGCGDRDRGRVSSVYLADAGVARVLVERAVGADR